MSKIVNPCVYIDENVSSVEAARRYADKATEEILNLKGKIKSLVMATPKDITPEGEDPVSYLEDIFDDLWCEVEEQVVNEYVYTIVADDVAYTEDSLVKEVWEREKVEEEEIRRENLRRTEFFRKHCLSESNFNDWEIYRAYKAGEIGELDEPLTEETRDKLVKEIKERERKVLADAINVLKEKKNGK